MLFIKKYFGRFICDLVSLSLFNRPAQNRLATGLAWGLLPLLILLASFVTPTTQTEARTPDTVHGEQLYLKYCSACHHELVKVGPPLIESAGYFVRAGVPAEAIGTLLRHPVRSKGEESVMPSFSPDEISDADLDDLGLFLASHTEVPAEFPSLGDAENGADLYYKNCAVCHGKQGEGASCELSLAELSSDLKDVGANPQAILGYVFLATRSGNVWEMLTFSEKQLSDSDLEDLSAHLWNMPYPFDE